MRQTGATLGARGVPASHAALYATRLQRPPSAPRFSPPAPVPTAQARGFPASTELRAEGVSSEKLVGSFKVEERQGQLEKQGSRNSGPLLSGARRQTRSPPPALT